MRIIPAFTVKDGDMQHIPKHIIIGKRSAAYSRTHNNRGEICGIFPHTHISKGELCSILLHTYIVTEKSYAAYSCTHNTVIKERYPAYSHTHNSKGEIWSILQHT
jgi:hypothetical protein